MSSEEYGADKVTGIVPGLCFHERLPKIPLLYLYRRIARKMHSLMSVMIRHYIYPKVPFYSVLTADPTSFLSCLQELLQLSGNSITDFTSLGLASDITGANARLDHVADSGLNGLGFDWSIERVLQHHCHGQDGGDWVDDALAGNVRGRA